MVRCSALDYCFRCWNDVEVIADANSHGFHHAEGRVHYNDYGQAYEEFDGHLGISRGQAKQFFEDLLRRKTKDFSQLNQEDRNRGLDATVG